MDLNKNNIKEWLEALNIERRDEKEFLGYLTAKKVKNNQIIGFGSGTTALITADIIGKLVEHDNLNIKVVPTSEPVKLLCEYYGIEVVKLEDVKLDWCFDGADEVDENSWFIKGKGGALYKEKLNIKASPKTYILIDTTKHVQKIGEKNLVPVECEKGLIENIKEDLIKIGANIIKLRLDGQGEPYITENNNYILDVKFNKITQELEEKINLVKGVIENGLFIGYNVEIVK